MCDWILKTYLEFFREWETQMVHQPQLLIKIRKVNTTDSRVETTRENVNLVYHCSSQGRIERKVGGQTEFMYIDQWRPIFLYPRHTLTKQKYRGTPFNNCFFEGTPINRIDFKLY